MTVILQLVAKIKEERFGIYDYQQISIVIVLRLLIFKFDFEITRLFNSGFELS